MLKQLKLSIIVPVYNAEKYLQDCIEMLQSQPIHDFEIILVNDGSQDGSEQICKKYEQKAENIIYVYQENQGPSVARNTGLAYARGEYVAFCDSDDKVDENIYQVLLKNAWDNNADICLCDFYSERDGQPGGMPWEDETSMTRGEILQELIPSMIGNQKDFDDNTPLWGSVCRGIYKKRIIDEYQVKFPEDIRFAEDLVFSIRFLEHAQRAVILNQVLYYYTCNPDSIMNTHINYKPEMFQTRSQVLNYVSELLNSMNILENNKKRIAVTARAYFHEAVGNACRGLKKRGLSSVYREVKKIVNDNEVRNAYESFNKGSKKQTIVYQLIQNKCVALLVLYYCFRFKGE